MNEKLKLGLFFLGVFLVGFFGTYFILTITDKNKINSKQNIKTAIEENVISGAPNVNADSSSFNILLLGSGGTGHSGGGLTDSIIVLHLEPKNKSVSLISIPRDLWVPGNYKINASVTSVGLSNFKGVIQNITALPISYVVSVDFSGIVKVIDSLGEIEITLNKSYDDHFYPVRGLENETCGKSNEEIADLHSKYSGFELEKQFTCRYEKIHADSGTSKIDGAQALKLARSRHGDSDFGRSVRQFAILKGISQKLISMDAIDNIENLYNTLVQSVKTDISLKIAKDLANLVGNPNDYKINEAHLTEDNVLVSSTSSGGAYILIPKAGMNNFSEIKKFINGSTDE